MIPPFRVRSFGCINYNPYHFSPGTKDGDIMLILNLYGKGIFRNSDYQVELQPNLVLFIDPKNPGVIYSDKTEPYLHYYCRFSGDYAFHLVQQIITEKKSNHFKISPIEPLINCLKPLPYVIKKDLPEQMGEYELGLSRLLVSLLKNQFKTTKTKLTYHELKQYMVSEIASPNDLNQMAKYFQLSKPALCRSAKNLLGETIISASNKIRIENACQLLQMNVMNINEIAPRVGFEDQFYFSKLFKKIKGISPKKWQQLNTKG